MNSKLSLKLNQSISRLKYGGTTYKLKKYFYNDRNDFLKVIINIKMVAKRSISSKYREKKKYNKNYCNGYKKTYVLTTLLKMQCLYVDDEINFHPL